MALQAEMRHITVVRWRDLPAARTCARLRDYGEQLIAVEQMAALVRDSRSGRRPVERDTDIIGAQLQHFRPAGIGSVEPPNPY